MNGPKKKKSKEQPAGGMEAAAFGTLRRSHFP